MDGSKTYSGRAILSTLTSLLQVASYSVGKYPTLLEMNFNDSTYLCSVERSHSIAKSAALSHYSGVLNFIPCVQVADHHLGLRLSRYDVR